MKPDMKPDMPVDWVDLWRLSLAPDTRRARAVVESALSRILARYLDCAESEVRIDRAPSGKPFLVAPEPAVQFNVTHSRDQCLIAICGTRSVGVDLEFQDRPVDALRLARRYYSSDEADAFEEMPADERRHAFLCSWTRKEAIIKAEGRTIAAGLDRLGPDVDGNWRLQPVDVPGLRPHYCHVALVGKNDFKIRHHEWSPC